MSQIHIDGSFPSEQLDFPAMTFKLFDVAFHTDAISIKPRATNNTYHLDLCELYTIRAWDVRLEDPFFVNHSISFISKSDREFLPEDLRAIFKLQAIFFNDDGKPLFEVFTKGSYKKTSYAKSAFNALLNVKRFTNKRTEAMVSFYRGMAHEYGLGCNVFKQRSVLAYKKAADLGSVKAQILLGCKAKDAEDYDEAFKYFSLAVAQDSAEAMNELGDLYYYGQGAQADKQHAIELFRKSAQNGYQLAIDNLDRLHMGVEGIDLSSSSVFSSSFEGTFIPLPSDTERMSPTMSPKTLPLKKRPIVHGLKKQLLERFTSEESDDISSQSSKRQKMSVAE